MKNNKKIVFFDLDGTLSPPRKKMQHSMSDCLYHLQKENFEIGVVTGSDLDYIYEQCDLLWDLNPIDYRAIHFLPCNGTKYYRFDAGTKMNPVYELDMREHLGEKHWRRLAQLILNLQSAITRVHRKIPLTGTFVQYRGSTLNWCPIGREASDQDRQLWAKLNADNSIREKWFDIAKAGLESANLNDVVIKYGGETSFDIYPAGWDKTYPMKNYFSDYDEQWFVGDRCGPYGNDFEAFVLAGNKGFQTTGPEDTIKIVEHHILAQK
jgi:phosphomannomutase